MVKTNFIFIVIVLAAIALLTVQGAGAIFGTSTLSVSKTTLNGQDIFLVTQNVGSNLDVTTATISKASYPQFDSDRIFTLEAYKENDAFTYTATDRSDFSSAIYKYEIYSHCQGSSWLGGSCSVSIDSFRGACTAQNPMNIFFDGGDLTNPDWYCYKAVPKWKVSDFNNIGGYSNPQIKIYTTEFLASQPSNPIDQAEVTLNNQHTFDTLSSVDGKVYGRVSIESLQATFNEPPSSSGIKAIRPSGSNTGFIVVSSSALESNGLIKTQFTQMLAAAKKPTAGQPILTAPFGLFPLGVTYFESVNVQQAITAIDWYNAQIDMLPSAVPAGQFQGLDVSKMDTQKTVSLKNTFRIPQIKYELYADAVGVKRANAVPVSVSCNSKTLPGGSTTGEFTVTATNGVTAGSLIVGASCAAPIYVTTTEGAYDFGIGETKQLSFAVTLSPNNATSKCTVTAKSTDGVTVKTGVCDISQTAACPHPPKVGFYQDMNCVDYCPLTVSQCAPPKILKTPATGYADQCTCDSGNVSLTCNNNNLCETGETKANCPNDCHDPPINATSCLPYVQKINTEQVGATTFGVPPIAITFGGTTVQSCVWDFPILAAALLVLAGALLLMKKEKYAKVVGIVGLLLLVLSFVADNATLLALGGMGIFLIALVAMAAYVALRLHLI